MMNVFPRLITRRIPCGAGVSVQSFSAILRSPFLILLVAIAGWSSSSFGVDDPENFYPERLIAPLPLGALGRPFGESVVVQGKVVEGPFKGEYSYLSRLLVQRINGVATQQGMVIRFDPLTASEWMGSIHDFTGGDLRKAREKKAAGMQGKSFEIRGYEIGEHMGMTSEEFIIQRPMQSSGFEFRLRFQALMMKAIPEIHYSPSDFSNRVAELEGQAETHNGVGYVMGADGWKLRVRDTAWPQDFEETEVSVRGHVVRSSTGHWQMEDAVTRQLLLSDQLRKETQLDGVAWSSNDVWWFEYRGEKLFVENQKNLPGWSDKLYGKVLTVSGFLDIAEFPDPEQTSNSTKLYYIVRHASWAPLNQQWKNPPKIPKAPPLTLKYLKSCGIKLEGEMKKRFEEWEKKAGR